MQDEVAGALHRWGFGAGERAAWEAHAAKAAHPGIPGRVASEHKGGLFVATSAGERHAVVPGKLRRAARGGESELPAVGDWVAVSQPQGDGAVQVLAVLPRKSVLARKAAGEREVRQVLAANVDRVLLVAALGLDLNLRRLERALAMVRESSAAPALILSKADLCADPAPLLAQAREVAREAPVLLVSARTGLGVPELEALLEPGRTAVLLGSSGVGKSTLVNRWLGSEQYVTSEVDAEGKGRHATTHRQLVPLPWGALVIDTPGLRELGLWESGEGLRETFDDIDALSASCRFRNCAHQGEPGCAARAAVEQGALAADRLESFLKLRGEVAARQVKLDARAQADEKAKTKELQRRMNALNRKRH